MKVWGAHRGHDLKALVLAAVFAPHLLVENVWSLPQSPSIFRCDANTFPLWLSYKGVED